MVWTCTTHGKRRHGRPHLWFKDSGKRGLHSANIDVGSLEDTAAERPSRRHAVYMGVEEADARRCRIQSEKREKNAWQEVPRVPKMVQSSSVMFATKTVPQGSGYTVATDVAQEPFQSAIHRLHGRTEAYDH